MDDKQLDKVRSGRGFFAALDQSGGSTPKALALYGIPESSYSSDEEMFGLVHMMRSRIVLSPSFGGDRVLGAIIFENTMGRQFGGRASADYLWDVKGVVPFLKVDKGLEPEADGAQVMKPISDLGALLDRAVTANIFGTKMRSFIVDAHEGGVSAVVSQQFDIAARIIARGFMPIIEPEISIHSPGKAKAEALLQGAINEHLDALPAGQQVVLKLTLPERDNFYAEFVAHPKVLRVLALSGGYPRDEANDRLSRNHGVVASFSRALMEGLNVDQSGEEFDAALDRSIQAIFEASNT